MRINALILSTAALFACDPGDATMDDQLEALSISAETAADADASALESGWLNLSGTASVQGSDRDFTLTLDGDASQWRVDVHSPAQSDLSSLDGQSLRVHLPVGYDGSGNAEDYWWNDGLAIIEDDDGPVWYGNLVGAGMSSVRDTLGHAFIEYGERTGKEKINGNTFFYKDVVVATDDGPVTVAAGESAHLTIGGDVWRFVLIAAYEVDHETNATKCMGPPDVLAFEMLRLSDAGEDSFVSRPSGYDAARTTGCGG